MSVDPNIRFTETGSLPERVEPQACFFGTATYRAASTSGVDDLILLKTQMKMFGCHYQTIESKETDASKSLSAAAAVARVSSSCDLVRGSIKNRNLDT